MCSTSIIKIIVFIILICSTSEHCMAQNALKLAISSFQEKININEMDPAQIAYVDQWNMCLNMYGRLIDYSPNREIVSDIAKKFYWKGNEAHFEIRDDIKTVDGIKITAEDVVYSFKRLLLLSSNTHGKLDNIICDVSKIKKLSDDCEGISFKKNTVIFKTKKQDQFFFSTITSADFSIIPKQSIDLKTFKIKDYRNTSGAYYFNGYKDGHIILKANPHNWNYSKDIPQEIEIIPDYNRNEKDTESAFNKILRGEIDATTNSGTIYPDGFDRLTKQLSAKSTTFDFKETHPLFLDYFKFSERGLGLDKKIRFAILQDIQSQLQRKQSLLEKYCRKSAKYVFPDGGYGHLTSLHKKEYLEKLSAPIEKTIPKMTVIFGTLTKKDNLYEDLFEGAYFKYKRVEVANFDEYARMNQDDPRTPHIYLQSQDVLFYEAINLISFIFSDAGMFSFKKEDAYQWLTNFRAEADKKKRFEMLERVHFDVLANDTKIIPMFYSSPQSIALNGWKLNQSPYSAETRFWLMRHSNEK